MQPQPRVLLVDDDPFALETFAEALAAAGIGAIAVDNGNDAVARLASGRFDLLITDVLMEPIDGLALMQMARNVRPDLPSIVVTGHPSFEGSVHAMRAGAIDYLAKPFHVDELVGAVRTALSGSATSAARRPEIASPRSLLGTSGPILRINQILAAVAASESSVLLTGEPGSGREETARAIHAASRRNDRPFIAVDCAAVSSATLLGALFGSRSDGGPGGRTGLLHDAQGGTVFLHEVAAVGSEVQAALRRAILERRVRSFSSASEHDLDVRFVASASSDLRLLVESGRFCAGLFLKLSVIPLELPALRERIEDLPLIAENLAAFFSERSGKDRRSFTSEALSAMSRHAWPGNIPELENVVERAVVLGGDGALTIDDLPHAVRCAESRHDRPLELDTLNLAEVEQRVIVEVLELNSWNIKRSAGHLGITRATLYSKIKRNGLAPRG